MGKVTGAQLLIRSLRAEGVDTLFTLSGTAILGTYDHCAEEGLRLIDGRHESAVVHTAEGYARAKAEPAVAMVTEGPGHANAMPGLACAYAEGSPVLLISGVAHSHGLGSGANQEIPQVEMAAPITKWSALVPSAGHIPAYVARAFRHMRTGEPGPTHLSIPVDRLDEDLVDAEATPILGSRAFGPTAGAGAAPRLVDQALLLLAGAKRPLEIAGTTAYWSKAADAVRGLVEATRTPVLTTSRARGLVSDEHPLCFGGYPYASERMTELVCNADLVVVLGEKLDLGFVRVLPPGAAIVHVHPNPAEVGRNRPVAVGIAASVDIAAEQLAEAARGRAWPKRTGWLGSLERARSELDETRREAAPGGAPVHPLQVSKALESLLDAESFLVTETSSFAWWSMEHLEQRRPGRWQHSTVLWMLGTGIPYALGAKAAFPESRVVLVSGDGSFGFYPMEFDTAVRHNLPIVAIVGADEAWGIEQKFQEARFGEGRLVATSLRPTRYDKMIEAMGGHGEHVEQPDELAPALERAFASGKPACINVVTETALPPSLGAYVESLKQQQEGLHGRQR